MTGARDLRRLMAEAVDLSTAHVRAGGIPFSALVVTATGEIVGTGVNCVRADCDPTAHAEVVALRDACRALRTTHLQGATLLASGEPCAMCCLSALYAGIQDVFYAIDRRAAARYGFDYTGSYTLFAEDPTQWGHGFVRPLAVPNGLEPFEAYRAKQSA